MTERCVIECVRMIEANPEDADNRPRPRRIMVGPLHRFDLAHEAMQRLKTRFETLVIHELHDEYEVALDPTC